ncbi:MAG TPA: cation diffusion facilitator family transporter [Thermoleophilaceae bacterium]|nr:cation diffusion facilitator family transporter [Thermoleophilaceae bacterium]
MGDRTRKTVLVAIASNATIFLTKAVGGVMSGSSALLAEAAHSLADTTNQCFLLFSLKQAERARDETHPFGHGQERFLWAFMAAMFMFVGGAVFAVGYGIKELLSGGEKGSFTVAWVVLGISAVAEIVSWVRAMRQTRAEAAETGLPFIQYVRESRDPTAKAVVFEDSAAVVGLVIAAVGIGLHQLTGQSAWDALAAVLVGLLLMVTAVSLGRDIRGLLTGEAARPAEREQIERVLNEADEVEHVFELLTMVLGPSALLVAARIDLKDAMTAEEIERASNRLANAVREAVPDVREVFLDPTARARELA